MDDFLHIPQVGYAGCTPPTQDSSGKYGLGLDSLPEMFHNPGGDDCILGRGADMDSFPGKGSFPDIGDLVVGMVPALGCGSATFPTL